jgi:hypothetical protein
VEIHLEDVPRLGAPAAQETFAAAHDSAAALNVRGRSKMSKAELAKAIARKQD